jgi:hypothetical protein
MASSFIPDKLDRPTERVYDRHVSRLRTRRAKRVVLVSVCAIALAAGFGLGLTVAAGSSTQIGQTTSAPTFGVNTPAAPFSTVPGTPSYETPHGVLTSWRFHSSTDPSAGSVRLKIFRYLGPGYIYKVLAESSEKALAPNTAYDFKERIPVNQGDLIGLTAAGDAEIGISVPATPQNQLAQFGGGDIPPGSTATATIAWPNLRANVEATVESDLDNDGFGDDTQDRCPVDPTTQALCQFSFGKLKKNARRGTAILPVTVPGAGTVALSGNGVVSQQASAARSGKARAVTSASTVNLLVKAKGKARGKLGRHGKAKVKPLVTFTPTGGPAVAQQTKVKLVKTL